LDHRHGDEACLDAVLLRVRECRETAEASATPVVCERRHIALADLHNLGARELSACIAVGIATPARQLS
jgi:hypothetical protein